MDYFIKSSLQSPEAGITALILHWRKLKLRGHTASRLELVG